MFWQLIKGLGVIWDGFVQIYRTIFGKEYFEWNDVRIEDVLEETEAAKQEVENESIDNTIDSESPADTINRLR